MNISTAARYIDQPVILNNLQKNMPAILIAGGTGFGLYDSLKHSKKYKDETENRNHFLRNSIIIVFTVTASLIGTRGLKIGKKEIFSGLMENKPLLKILEEQRIAVNKFLQNTKTKNQQILKVLEKSKNGKLKMSEIELISQKIPESKEKEALFAVILPKPENHTSNEIFSEIKRLSLLGLVPVVGGIAGGIAADKATGAYSEKSVSNKVKEGFYQYFANIFLCNVGAGAALFTAEKLQKSKIIKPLTPLKKLAVIMAGIAAAGIVGGSFIANYLSKKLIDPLFCKDDIDGKNKKSGGLYSERKPEMLDIALHADDIATAGVLSGFKWIEPALPFLYFISGYRAGTGYRNGGQHPHGCKNNFEKNA